MNFGPLSLGLMFMAGLTAAACIQHSLNAWRSAERDDWIFAAGALSLAASILLALGYNNAKDAEAYRFFYQWHALASRPFFLAWAYFILRFAGFSSPWPYRIWLGAEGLKALLLLAFIRTPYFVDITSVASAAQPWGEEVSFPIGRALPLQFIQVLMPLLSLGFTLAGALRLLRHGRHARALFLGLAVSASVGAVLYDNLADWLAWPDMAVAEFMVVVPVLFLGWASSDRLVQAALTRRRLRESQGLVNAMLNSLRDGVIGLDNQGRILWMNPAAQALSGGLRDDQALDLPKLLEPVEPAAKMPGSERVRRVRGSGRLVEPMETPLLDENGRPLGRLLLLRDVTRLLDLHDQVARGRQMKMLGELAAGLAHDLRNVLAAIRLSSSSLRLGGDPGADLDSLDAACGRAAGLTQRLLSLGRGETSRPGPVEAGAILNSAAALLRPSLPPGLTLRVETPGPGLQAWADAVLLESALLNLGLNARDASPAGGDITLAASAQAAPDGRAGVTFEVADRGPGIPPEQQARLFEPFYSTKDPTAGSGLGLMMVQYAAQSLGGTVQLESGAGQGSRFRLWLPAPPPAPPVETRGEVLVLDDEAMVARGLQRLLGRQGREALAVSDPEEALELVRRHPGRFRALITDLSMPRVGGLEVLRRARALDPRLAVILSTGSDAMNHGDDGFDAVIEKPYTLEQLNQALAKAEAAVAARA